MHDSIDITIRQVADRVGSAADLWVATWKIGYPLSVVAGLWVLRMFTVRAAIPFPEPDGSLLVLLALCGLACFLLLVWIGSVAIMPMIFTWFDPQLVQLLPANLSTRPTFAQLRQYVRRFLLVFGPYVTLTVFFPIIVVISLRIHPQFDDNGPRFQGLFPYALVGAAACAALVLALSCLLYKRSADGFVKPRGTNQSSTRAFFGMSLGACCLYYPWTNAVLLIAIPIALRIHLFPSDASALWAVLIYLGIVVWQFVATTLILWRALRLACLVASIIVFCIPVTFFGSQIGAVCLRFAGMGGGIPITYVAKVPYFNSPNQNTKQFDGCLVLRTGTTITVQLPVSEGEKLTICQLNPRTPLIIGGNVIRTTTNTIRNSDVIDLVSLGTIASSGTESHDSFVGHN